MKDKRQTSPNGATTDQRRAVSLSKAEQDQRRGKALVQKLWITAFETGAEIELPVTLRLWSETWTFIGQRAAESGITIEEAIANAIEKGIKATGNEAFENWKAAQFADAKG